MEAPLSSPPPRMNPNQRSPSPSPPGTTIVDLNVDSLAQCASYLTLQDLSNFAMTCNYFKKVAYSDSVWQRFYRERWPQQPPSFGSQTPGVREAYLSMLKDSLQFKFTDPIVVDFYTAANSNRLDHILLDKNDIIFSQGSLIRVLTIDRWLNGTDSPLTLVDHNARITCMRLFPLNETSLYRSETQKEENALVTSSADHSIRLWWKGACRRCFRGHSGPVSALSDKLLGDGVGKVLASGGEDGTVRLWSLSSGGRCGQHALKATFYGHEKPIRLMSVAGHNTSHLVTVSRDSKVRVWDTNASSFARSSCCVGMTSTLGAPIDMKCNEHLVYVAAGSSVTAIDLRTMQKVVIAAVDAKLYSFQARPSKSLFCIGSHGRVMLYDLRMNCGTLKSEPIAELEAGHKGPVNYLHMDPYKIVTGSPNDMHVNIWEADTGALTNSLSCALMMETVTKFDTGGEGLPVKILEVHHVGRLSYVLASDASGKISVYRENGSVHGSTMPSSRPLAFLKQRLLFLTETGAGSLDLRTMKVRESECEGLNRSHSRNYVFDPTERSKAYGLTSEGDLIQVLLLGDIKNFKCRVRSKRKFEIDEPLAFQAIKGCLLIVSREKVFVYNVSTQHYVRVGAPRIIFSAGLDEIRSSFLNYQTVNAEKRNVIPLIASDRERLVVLGLGGGYVGMYRSNLPEFKGEFNTMLWTSPVFFFVLFLFGAWQFFAKKREALTSWGADDPFSSTSGTTGAPLGGSSAGDRKFVDSSSRNPDMMELRGGDLRGPPRRFPSPPPRYTGGATSSFRPGTTDHNARPLSVDPNFRTTSELKFRGSGLESSGFPNRRESLFVNNQVMDDSS